MAPETVIPHDLSNPQKSELPAPPRRIVLCGVLALSAGITLVGVMRARSTTEYTGELQVHRMPIVAGSTGIVAEILTGEGDAVRIGDPLLSITNPDVQTQRTRQQQVVAALTVELEQSLARAELELDWRLKELNQDIFTTQIQSAELLEEKYLHEMEKVALGDLLSSNSLAMWTQEDTVFDSLVLQDHRRDEGRLKTVLRLEAAANAADVCSAQVDLCDQQVQWLDELKQSLPSRVEQSFGVPLAQSRLREAEAELSRLEQAQEQEVIDSPAIGMTGVFHVRPGTYVKAGDLLVEVLDHARQSLTVEVPSGQVDQFPLGREVKLIFPGAERRSGRVIRVAPQTVPTTRNARDKSASLIAVELEPAGKVWPTMPVGTEIRVVLRD